MEIRLLYLAHKGVWVINHGDMDFECKSLDEAVELVRSRMKLEQEIETEYFTGRKKSAWAEIQEDVPPGLGRV